MTTLLTQTEASLMRDIEAKVEAHLNILFDDYTRACRVYKKLVDFYSGELYLNAREEANAQCRHLGYLLATAKAAYRAIGLTGQIGIHTL
jgi:hypothetical protein